MPNASPRVVVAEGKSVSIPQAHQAFLAEHRLGVIAAIKPNGRPHLSTIMYRYSPDDSLARISLTDDRVKVAHLRRDPRASLHVMSGDGWHWVVAEGTVRLSPVARKPDDATVEELVALYRSLSGEHPNWAEFRAAMVAEKRLVARLAVERTYGAV